MRISENAWGILNLSTEFKLPSEKHIFDTFCCQRFDPNSSSSKKLECFFFPNKEQKNVFKRAAHVNFLIIFTDVYLSLFEMITATLSWLVIAACVFSFFPFLAFCFPFRYVFAFLLWRHGLERASIRKLLMLKFR